MEGETLYGSEDSQSVMSERVQTLARNIYQEFQRMIQKYDEDVVKVRDITQRLYLKLIVSYASFSLL